MISTKKLLAAFLASFLLIGSSHAIMISGGFTGNWFNPEASGQGFQLQVMPDGRAVAFWFTYDANGNQVWLVGEDYIDGNTLNLQMSQPVGASFGDGYNSDDVELIPFGTVSLTFDDCNSGTATWQSSNPDFGSGQMPLQRLSSSAGVNCTGSAADNNSGATPVQDFRISLLNEGVYPLGSGHADYESRPGNIDFDVEIEDVPAGDYTLLVDGIDRGSITVVATDDGTEGEVEYSSPQDGDDRLLDFDPLGALIEVTEGDIVLFSAVLEPNGTGPGDDGGDDDSSDAPPFGSSETEVDLINTGLDPDASGDAELEQRSNRVEFDVEIEDLDTGTYELWVGGELRGEIQVVPSDDGTEGEIEFRNPVEAGKELLDFDPIGQWISIEQGGNVFLEAQFPTELGTGDDDDDDDGNDDGGSDDDDDAGNDDDDDDDEEDDDEEDDEDEDDDDDDDDDDEEDEEDDD
ncbi:hypothetical protein [Wenzhouxiangella sediminis]|uniref:hypothetical protein n=1 Tax=Wenzhouxiangella sediminis TaxID=1792836 RepID=UPI0015F27C5F|nr:hypothetical protein [Wenzhouxiangella sediminis]